MAQSDILDLLEKEKRPLASRELQEALDLNMRAVFKALGKLVETGEVNTIEVDRREAYKYFGSKRRMNLYYSAEIKINKKDLNSLFALLEDTIIAVSKKV